MALYVYVLSVETTTDEGKETCIEGAYTSLALAVKNMRQDMIHEIGEAEMNNPKHTDLSAESFGCASYYNDHDIEIIWDTTRVELEGE